ncbi:predicted protein [Histoplasma capsulatum var. duboisii H88]|uniref:Predicted protein n=1 Tax=Ajellomyces capsulatus (strain H88) TaxID=544711 RepID=F0U740_AJEC8|nr:predicted protein [Histoplasma capsulatum var. duboisii H88]
MANSSSLEMKQYLMMIHSQSRYVSRPRDEGLQSSENISEICPVWHFMLQRLGYQTAISPERLRAGLGAWCLNLGAQARGQVNGSLPILLPTAIVPCSFHAFHPCFHPTNSLGSAMQSPGINPTISFSDPRALWGHWGDSDSALTSDDGNPPVITDQRQLVTVVKNSEPSADEIVHSGKDKLRLNDQAALLVLAAFRIQIPTTRCCDAGLCQGSLVPLSMWFHRRLLLGCVSLFICLAPVGLKLQWFSREHLALQMGVSSCIYEVPAGRLHAQEDILSPMHGIPDQKDAAYYP